MPGSFDPFTLGHWDVLVRASRLFDEVVVAVGVNSGKQAMFSVEDRVAMIEQAVAALPTVSVSVIDGLLVDFCARIGASVVVRGARSGYDFESESAMAAMNASLGEVETVVLPASATVGFISSTLVRAVARAGGDVTPYVPSSVSLMVKKEL
jgi:pantetheine-phosphate adenylyltransferase